MDKDIMASEISQSQKDKPCMIPLTWDIENGQFQRDRKWNGGCQGLGGGENRELLVNGDRLSVLDDEESLEMDGGDAFPAMWVYWTECHWTVQQGKYSKFVYFTPIWKKKQQIYSRGNQSNGYLWEREMDGGTEEPSGVWESSIFDLQVLIRA